jgi:hypothetical protein
MPGHIRVFENVLSPEFCRDLIAKFDNDTRVQPDPQPSYSTRSFLDISLFRDWTPQNTTFCRYVNELVASYFHREGPLAAATHTEWADDGYVMCCYDVGDSCILHTDGQCAVEPTNGLRLATLVFYLNDVPLGGETVFPVQNLKIAPVQGRAVMFPVGFTHPHQVMKASSKRYIMQTWITDPNLLVRLRD